MEEQRRQNRSSSSSATGLLLVCTSLFVWLLVDTLIAMIPPSEINITHFHSSSPDLAESNPGDDNAHLWWFVQISDIHLSSFRNFHIPDNFQLFLREVIPTVKPVIVLATGDLTDGKKTNILASAQEPSEWKQYRNLLEEHLLSGSKNEEDRPIWIDMRGNHDNFDVSSHSDDFFSKFGVFAHRWKSNNRHVVHKFTVNNTLYAIVATDATPDPGFRRPYNFFGILSEATLDEFAKTDAELAEQGVQLAIWSGHYTSSTVFVGGTFSSERRLMGDVVRHGAVYLCGHLHTAHDAEMAMYARHAPLGQLELELADFQRTSKFRIFAVDHGLVSFTDVPIRQWPIVLVVNPKEALFSLPNYEPLDKIVESTHIRILAFSTSKIEYVQVSINGVILGNATRHPISHSLYTLPWSPKSLLGSESLFHRLDVVVVDESKRNISERSTFFVDPKAVSELPANVGGPFASFLLLLNVPKICRNAFTGASFFCLILLMTARFYPDVFLAIVPAKSLARGFILFSSVPRLIFVTVLFVISYSVLGPWFIGEVMTGRFALIFAHGILLIDDGTFIPCAVVAFNGFTNVLTFYFPLLFYFAWLCSSPPTTSRLLRISQRLLLQFLILWQIWAAYGDAQAYGWLAFIFSPMRTWSSLVIVYIDIQVRKHRAIAKGVTY